MNLWELKRGMTFVFDDEPDKELIFLGMDGMYAKVRALDPEINKELCARYDANRRDFFCIMCTGTVTVRLPEVLKDLGKPNGKAH